MEKKVGIEDKILSGYLYRNKPVTNVTKGERVINIITGHKGAKELVSAFRKKGASDDFIAENIEVFINEQWTQLSKVYSMVKTAKEFLEDAPFNGQYWEDKLIAFAQMHVKAAIEAVIEDAPCGSSTDTVSCEEMKEAVLNAYPLTNIK